MSTSFSCPNCSRVTKHNVFPLEGWGHFLTDGAEDALYSPRVQIEDVRGDAEMFVCDCLETVLMFVPSLKRYRWYVHFPEAFQ